MNPDFQTTRYYKMQDFTIASELNDGVDSFTMGNETADLHNAVINDAQLGALARQVCAGMTQFDVARRMGCETPKQLRSMQVRISEAFQGRSPLVAARIIETFSNYRVADRYKVNRIVLNGYE